MLNQQQLSAICGQPTQKSGNHIFYRCPICAESGQDTAGNNLVYNYKTYVYNCFADENHGKEIYKRAMQLQQNQPPVYPKPQKLLPKKQNLEIDKARHEKMLEMADRYNYNLMQNAGALKYLQDTRGINPYTAYNCQIGLTDDKSWAFPVIIKTYEYNKFYCYYAGFEYREQHLPKGKGKKVWKEPGTPSVLSIINPTDDYEKQKKHVICEGFLDAYIYYQYTLTEEGRHSRYCYDIMTPTNGVGTIPDLINTIHYDYSETLVIVDRDKAGDEAIKGIKQKSNKKVSVFNTDCDCCEDLGDWWMKHYLGKE